MKNTNTIKAALIAAIFVIPASANATSFIVSYEAEAPGVQSTTATFSAGGVETFNNVPAQTYPQSFSTDFGTSSAITGTYKSESGSGVQINSADQYGGAGGTGNYIVSFPSTPYSLTLSSNIKGGVNYFGYWLSALDPGNSVTFYGDNGQKLFTFNPQDVITAINKSSDPSLYYGNPNSTFKGQDSGEPFVFVNFFDTNGTFSKIEFSEVNYGGGYESDNHTVGHYLTYGTGTVVPLTLSTGVPEPSTWAMMLLGFLGLGFMGRKQAVLALN